MTIIDIGVDVRPSNAYVDVVEDVAIASVAAAEIEVVILNLGTSRTALDALVTAADTADANNDATAEIAAIHTGPTGYDHQYDTIIANLNAAIADLTPTGGARLNSGDIIGANQDLLLAIDNIVTADTALDALVTAANAADVNNDATTEINAIQTRYAADLLSADSGIDAILAQLNSLGLTAQNNDVVMSFNDAAIKTTGQLRRGIEEAFEQAKRSGVITEGA